MKRVAWVPRAVMAWTAFLTVFTWTPTMRGLWRPDISKWAVFGLQGEGREGSYWVFPAAASVALLLFYLAGRGRLRPLFFALLLVVHVPLTVAIVWASVTLGSRATFQGATWGWNVPLAPLAVPFVIFTALALLWIRQSGTLPPAPVRGWGEVNPANLAFAFAVLPLIGWCFTQGQGFDAFTKLATALSVLQWLFLIGGVQPRPPSPHQSAPEAKSA